MFNMLWLVTKFGEIWGLSPLVFVRGHCQEIGIAALPLGLKSRHTYIHKSFLYSAYKCNSH